MTKAQLTKYLKSAVEIESRVYTQTTVINNLDSLINSLGLDKEIKEVNEPYKYEEDELYVWLAMIAMLALFGSFLLWLGNSCNNSPFSALGYCSFISTLIPLGLFVRTKKNMYIRNKEYQTKVTARQKAIENDKQRVKKELSQKVKLTEQRQMLYNKYLETINLRNEFYSYDIIFKKYRNFVAVCSFYEYLSAGRCATLEGHEGAYNIYETESRLDKILTKLDDVIRHLESIEQNQYMLYDAIKEGNQKTSELISNVKQLTASTNYAADQTAIAAQNSAWAAQELNTLKWLEVLR